MKSVRQAAFEALLKIHKDGAYSNLVVDSILKENPQLDDRDKAFLSNLVYGSLDRLMLIDYNLGLYLNQPSKKLKPELHTILVLGAYQILFMDRVPDHAAVSESVELAKVNKSSFAASLVNAVLRRVADNGLKYPEMDETSPEFLAIKYSCPEWLVALWIDSYGFDNAVKIAEKAMDVPPVTVRANRIKIEPDELIWKLAEEGVISEKSPDMEDTLILSNTGAVDSLRAYEEGLFHAQDRASQLCCAALDPKPGETVFDMCSAPGGKAFTMAEMMNNQGCIKAFDIYQSRVDLIRKGAERMGLTCITPLLSDAMIYNANFGTADRVLCDVPCSGLGVIRRKPEIRYKNNADITNLPDIQYRILCNSVRYLKPGGRLVYSTCTLNPEENDNICDKFLKEHRDFRISEYLPQVPRYSANDKYLTLLPHIHNTDGFFIAAFDKTE
ncbi:MAG: 16S rRNA (cytosine(967)-C(5))-methyltransferase RsmB [Clostridia bacterium]|nr:16S rRNA (cytosine(967)-C(5))-methyltransferase RsmB [Clostridia bacterium]